MDQVTLKDSVNRIKVKSRMLLSLYDNEKQQHRQARERIAELEEELRQQKRLNATLEQENMTLKMASVLSPDHRNVEATRAHLSGLVREIDKCITLLSH
ncbi:MAG: hypothetical protein K2H48_00415 [Duncaniella sp.]|nr:hypothetical protein [Duncaniella sp.]